MALVIVAFVPRRDVIVPAVALNIEAKRLVEVALVEVESIEVKLVIPPVRALRLVEEATDEKKLVDVALMAKRLVVEARDREYKYNAFRCDGNKLYST